jgi:alkylation response protein AidB-like acyl-CoA dehydrogenase
MSNLILDERDQRFVLFEMLDMNKLLRLEKYSDFSTDTFKTILSNAQKFATEEIFPTLTEADQEGCQLVEGNVRVPKCFHRPYKLFNEAGWNCMLLSKKYGGQGFPTVIRMAAHEWFMHNSAFCSYPIVVEGVSFLINAYGSKQQKNKYLPKMISGQWGGSLCITEPMAGTDMGNISTKAVKMPDGTYRLQGTKIFITAGDQDITENIVHVVLARIEGHPGRTQGLSTFIVPKYLVNKDGSLGKRNDYEVSKVEKMMGGRGSATCLINYGKHNDCYAELLGNERAGIKIMFQLINIARTIAGLQGLSSASIAYLHALKFARERLQGSSLIGWKNGNAPRVPIIQHADVRRMLLWMKSNVESMRALVYYTAMCGDMAYGSSEPTEAEKWLGIMEVLTPIVKAYCTDTAFRVIETSLQCHGGYGYCCDYPIEQFLRDEKVASIYGSNGLQAMDLVARKMIVKEQRSYFIYLLGEMNSSVATFKVVAALKDLAEDVQIAINTLTDVMMFFSACSKGGKFFVFWGNAQPFLMMMGKIVCAWLLLCEAAVAQETLLELCSVKGIRLSDPSDFSRFIKENKDAAFYDGKIKTAKYFIKNVLPEICGTVKAFKSEDISIMDIADDSFSSC